MFSREQLKNIIQDQSVIRMPEHYVERESFTQLHEWSKNDYIIVISGMRRTGKSTLLQKIRTVAVEQDFYLNFDDDRLVNFTVDDFQLLLETLIESFGEQSCFYFDEIQNILGWERFVRRLHDMKYKIYLTGSNSNLMSQELGTHLTGRYLQLEVFPYSFREWVGLNHPVLQKNKAYSTVEKGLFKRSFDEYEQVGGIPEFVASRIPESLSILYQNIIYRDILVRFKIPVARPLKEMMHYIASNLGKEISFNKLKTLVGLGSVSTVSSYAQYLENSYICFFLNRYDPSLKRQMLYHKKCYMIDIALAKQVGFRFSEDRGRLFENLVFLELRRHYEEIYFYQNKNECDFVVKQGSKIEQVIQVCLSLDQEGTYGREIKGLLEAMEHFQLLTGLILTEDESRTLIIDQYTIHIRPLWDWMLSFTPKKC